MTKKEKITAKLAAAAAAKAKKPEIKVNKQEVEKVVDKDSEQEKLIFEGTEYLIDNLTDEARQCVAHIKDIQTQRAELEKNSTFLTARIVQLRVTESSFVNMLKEQLPN